MVTAIFIILVVVFIIFLFTGTTTGKALKTRASGTASELVAKMPQLQTGRRLTIMPRLKREKKIIEESPRNEIRCSERFGSLRIS